jgi:hypothetical protein
LYGEYENLSIQDGVLYRQWIDQEGRTHDQIVLPEDTQMQQKMFKAYHDDMAYRKRKS